MFNVLHLILINLSFRYLRRLQEAAAAAAAGGQPDADSDASPPPPVSPHLTVSTSPSQSSLSPTITRREHTPFYSESSLRPLSAGTPGASLPPSRYPIAADGYNAHFSPVLPSPSYDITSLTNGLSNGHNHANYSPVDTFSTYPLHNWSYKQHQSQQIPSSKAWPPLSMYYRPHRLEEIAPRETFSLIITLFFDFV